MRRRTVIIIISIILILLSAACFAWLKFRMEVGEELIADDEEVDSYYELYCLGENNPTNAILYDGKVISANVCEIVLDPNYETIKNLYVNEGDYVEQGDILWSYDTSEIRNEISEHEYQARVDANQAENDNGRIIRELDNAIADREKQLNDAGEKIRQIRIKTAEKEDALLLAQRKQNQSVKLNNSKTDSLSDDRDSGFAQNDSDDDAQDDRLKEDDGFDESLSSEIEKLKSELENLNTELESALDDLNETDRSTAETVEQCRIEAEFGRTAYYPESAELNALYDKLEGADVRAPRSGIISALNIKEFAAADSDVAAEISDSDNTRVEIEAIQSDVVRIYPGMETMICMDTITGIRGVVTQIVKTPIRSDEDEETESKYKVMIDFLSQCDNLFIGMNVKVELLKEYKMFPFEIPEEYINSDDSGDYIFTAENISGDQYRVTKRYIQKGLSYEREGRAEIYFDGISNKTLVVTDPSGELEDGCVIDGSYSQEDTENEEGISETAEQEESEENDESEDAEIDAMNISVYDIRYDSYLKRTVYNVVHDWDLEDAEGNALGGAHFIDVHTGENVGGAG